MTMQTAAPGAICGAASAAVLASMSRWWLLGPLHGPTAVLVGALAGAAVGAALDASPTTARSAWRATGVWLPLASTLGLAAFVALRRDFWTLEECIALANVPMTVAFVGAVISVVVATSFARAEKPTEPSELSQSWWLTHVGSIPRATVAAPRGELLPMLGAFAGAFATAALYVAINRGLA